MSIETKRCECFTPIEHDGYLVCRYCGLVYRRIYEDQLYVLNQHGGDHWSTDFKQGVYLGERVHLANGMGSYVGFHSQKSWTDSEGNQLSVRAIRRFNRLQKIHKDVKGAHILRLYSNLQVLNKITRHFGLSEQVRDEAGHLLRRVLTPGYRHEGPALVYACVLYAIRLHEIPILGSEIVEYLETFRHRTNFGARRRARGALRDLGLTIPLVRPSIFVPRLIGILWNNQDVLKSLEKKKMDVRRFFTKLEVLTVTLLDSLSFFDYQGSNPFLFAASTLYVVTGENFGKLIVRQHSFEPEVSALSVRHISKRFWRNRLAKEVRKH